MSKVYKIITDKIIDKLETGTVPWLKPWNTEHGEIQNFISKKAYTGINPFILNMHDYVNPNWLTYKQAKDLGGNVKKGEKGEIIIFFTKLEKEDSNGDKKSFGMLRYYNVFNLEQTEGIDYNMDTTGLEHNPISECENIIKNYPSAPSISSSNKACYIPSVDTVNVPDLSKFNKAEEYYSTVFHELIHSTGAKKRLNRDFGVKFGDHKYSKEELTAEFGAAMLCGVTGIENKTLDNSASYIKSWIKALKNDEKLLISAASKAQKAANHIRGI